MKMNASGLSEHEQLKQIACFGRPFFNLIIVDIDTKKKQIRRKIS